MLLVPDEPAPRSTGGKRLSLLGHTLLTGGLVLMAAVGYSISHSVTKASVHQWDLCNHNERQSTQALSVGSGPVEWARIDQAQKKTILDLKVATPAQRQRLLEQRQEILETMNSYCLISHNFQIQFIALTSVGTAAAIFVTISLITVAPDGLKTNQRTLLNILMSSSIILAICVIYPQTFSQISNESRAVSVYQKAANMMRSFNSTLANQQISTNARNPLASAPLNSHNEVANFIRLNDDALDQLTSARLSFNNKFASDTFNQLNLQNVDTAPASPASPAPAAPSPAITP